MVIQRHERQNKIIAVIATIVIHGLLFLLFIWMVFTTPIPPFPDGGSPGVEIAFGNGDVGSGTVYESNNIGDNPAISNEYKTPASSSAPEEEHAAVTNDVEESVALKEIKKPKKNTTPKSVSEKEKKNEVPPEPQPDRELAEAMNILKSSKGLPAGGHGMDDKPGGVGSPDGTPGPEGGGGTGNGGIGSGDGEPGNKKRGNYVLRGRNMTQRPHIYDDSQEEGIVVVEIIVDETGKVLKATPGGRGTTTSNSVLWSKARQAALTQARFSPHPKGEKEQKGSITFVFKHQ